MSFCGFHYEDLIEKLEYSINWLIQQQQKEKEVLIDAQGGSVGEKVDFRISLVDIQINKPEELNFFATLEILNGRLKSEHGITEISFSIPPNVMGNRHHLNEEITCSEIMLFKNNEEYYDHPDCCGDSTHRFYDDEDEDEDEDEDKLGVEKFVEWLYKNNYEQP